MPKDYFGVDVALRYDTTRHDTTEAEMFAPEVVDPVVDLLAGLAGEGLALEFGVGTGRLALPLTERGVRVHGIDLSGAMLAQLRAKPGSDRVDVTIGDSATTRVTGSYTLAYLVFNTIMNLITQDEQVACFANAAAHLAPGGHFVIEVSMPRAIPFRYVWPAELDLMARLAGMTLSDRWGLAA